MAVRPSPFSLRFFLELDQLILSRTEAELGGGLHGVDAVEALDALNEVVAARFLADGSPDPATSKPGDTIHVLATAKALSSTTTFNTIDAPLRLTLSTNRQWQVDGFDEPIHFGAVHYQ